MRNELAHVILSPTCACPLHPNQTWSPHITS